MNGHMVSYICRCMGTKNLFYDGTGNEDTLGTELLESLLKMAPSKEEERKLKDYKDDSPVKLGPAEKFLKAVLDIPFAFKRVDAMLYIANFESEVEYLKKSFQTLEVIFTNSISVCSAFSQFLSRFLSAFLGCLFMLVLKCEYSFNYHILHRGLEISTPNITAIYLTIHSLYHVFLFKVKYE